MSVRHRMGDLFQYPGASGPTAYNWLKAWLDSRYCIRNHSENIARLLEIVPPTVDGCRYQLDFIVHVEHDTEADFQACYAQITDALQNGTIALADCDTSFGYNAE
jgi:hypothetical protein